jgi:myo-inositol-1(or 4)-monophosphatase
MTVDVARLKEIVVESGRLALDFYGKVTGAVKDDMSMFSEADGAVEAFLKDALTQLTPTFGYIGEETEDSIPPQDGETRSWVVDAIDGSRAFVAGMPLWTEGVCLLDGAVPVAGAAYNPVTGELFWADFEGPAFCNDQELRLAETDDLKPNTFILGPTNHHRTFEVDFPGRVYCLGAPIYQLCLVAKGSVAGLFFDPVVNLWDLALPALLFERTGGVMVYGSGRPVDLSELMDRRRIPEALYAGSPKMVETLRGRAKYKG